MFLKLLPQVHFKGSCCWKIHFLFLNITFCQRTDKIDIGSPKNVFCIESYFLRLQEFENIYKQYRLRVFYIYLIETIVFKTKFKKQIRYIKVMSSYYQVVINSIDSTMS